MKVVRWQSCRGCSPYNYAMSTRISSILLIAFALTIVTACNRQKIVLQKVQWLPDYFSESQHFGSSFKSLEERNEFLVVTGRIDTTTEVAPQILAVIMVGKKEIFLDLIKWEKNNGAVKRFYKGSGYELILTDREKKDEMRITSVGIPFEKISYEGSAVIKQGNDESVYKLVGVPGYH